MQLWLRLCLSLRTLVIITLYATRKGGYDPLLFDSRQVPAGPSGGSTVIIHSNYQLT